MHSWFRVGEKENFEAFWESRIKSVECSQNSFEILDDAADLRGRILQGQLHLTVQGFNLSVQFFDGGDLGLLLDFYLGGQDVLMQMLVVEVPTNELDFFLEPFRAVLKEFFQCIDFIPDAFPHGFDVLPKSDCTY